MEVMFVDAYIRELGKEFNYICIGVMNVLYPNVVATWPHDERRCI